MGATNSRGSDQESDHEINPDVARPAARLEPRRNQGGQRAADILYNLEQLYRSGQLRVGMANRNNYSNTRPRKIFRPADHPLLDTTVMDNSQFKQSVVMKSGMDISHYTHPPYGTVDIRCSNELRPLRSFEKVKLMQRLIPNGPSTVVVKSNEKLFCGLHSVDGNVFLTAGQDQVIRIFDTSRSIMQKDRLKRIRSFDARDVGWSVLDVRLSTCGKYLAYGSWSDYVHLATVHSDATHIPVHLHPPHNNSCGIFSLMFSHDDTELLCGANRGDIYICGIDTGRSQRIDAHSQDVNCVAFADDSSQILYSGGDDGYVKIWDRRNLSEKNPRPCGVFLGHTQGITFIDPHADGRHALSIGKDQTIRLWDIRKPSPTASLESSGRQVHTHTYDYRQRIRFAANTSRKKLESDTSIMTYYGPQVYSTLIRARFSPFESTASRYIYSGDADGRVFIIDSLTGEAVQVLQQHRLEVRDVSWHPHRPEIISTCWDGTQRLWQYGDEEQSAGEEESEHDDDDEEWLDEEI